MKITLQGQPLSTQHCYKNTCRGGYASTYMSGECKLLKLDYSSQCRKQYQGDPLQDELRVQITLYHGTKHKRDIDNFNKLILDALSGIIYKDDNQISELRTVREYDKSNPRAEVIISAT